MTTQEPERKMLPATYRCFDCCAFKEGEAASASFIGMCPTCGIGMMLVYTLDGEPKNRGYWEGRDE